MIICCADSEDVRKKFFCPYLTILAASPVFIGDWDSEVRLRYLTIYLTTNLTSFTELKTDRKTLKSAFLLNAQIAHFCQIAVS